MGPGLIHIQNAPSRNHPSQNDPSHNVLDVYLRFLYCVFKMFLILADVLHGSDQNVYLFLELAYINFIPASIFTVH
jgi:hypothetical protein